MTAVSQEKLKSAVACPACDHSGLSIFYQLDRIPVNSCLLLPTRDEARAFPHGDLELAACHHCGFITNVCFNPHLVSYTAQYEDQQSYSPTFNAFAKQLADQLTEQFNLRDKDILEIGCGKGDFLRLLCSSGGNRGTGIDPSISRRQIDEAHNNSI